MANSIYLPLILIAQDGEVNASQKKLLDILCDVFQDYNSGNLGIYIRGKKDPLYYVEITATDLNIRDGPSVSGTNIVGQTHRGSRLAVWQEIPVSGTPYSWLKISEEKSEWISGKYAKKV